MKLRCRLGWPRAFACPLALGAAVMFATACAGPDDTGIKTGVTGLLQLGASNTRFGDYLGDQLAKERSAELRLDATLACSEGFCKDTMAVLKPRLRVVSVDPSISGMLTPRRASLNEAYANTDISTATRVTLGKRYLGWGVGMLFSPSNRLFPDNGTARPRQEIDGKWLGMLSTQGERIQTTVLVADPYVQQTPGDDTSGAFYLARVERLAKEGGELTWGLLSGGGGGYQPYVGGYAQTILGGAWTLGTEWSASRGYARQSGPGTGLRADEDKVRGDALVGVRYGLSSGGELGAEYIYNGFRQSAAEQANPLVGFFPPASTTQTRYVLRSPLAEKDYLNLQINLPRLFDRDRWSLFLRDLEALESRGRLLFAELAYSPADRVTAFVGLTRTSGSSASTLTRALARAASLTLEIHF